MTHRADFTHVEAVPEGLPASYAAGDDGVVGAETEVADMVATVECIGDESVGGIVRSVPVFGIKTFDGGGGICTRHPNVASEAGGLGWDERS